MSCQLDFSFDLGLLFA